MKGTSQTVEESIRLEAYLLSEQAGHPPDMAKSFWVQAEAIIHGRIAAIAPSGAMAVFSSQPEVKKAPAKKTATAKKPAAVPAKKKDTQLLLAPELPATPKAAAKKVAAKAAKPKTDAPATKAAQPTAKRTAKAK